jgi:thiol-disulfide isomerase/thioredoxin
MTDAPLSPAAEHYNVTGYYREIHRGDRRAYAGQPLRVGMPAPDFRLPTVSGGVADGVAGLAALRRDGHVVIVFGCYSAPPCVRELPEISRLAAERPPGFRFVFIYTREIHPNEDLPYGRFAHHRSLDGKLAAARKLASDLSPDMTVAVDDLAGTVHLGYGGLPFCAAIVRRDGVLVHREEWASAGQLRAVIANLSQADRRLAAGEQPRLSLSETLWSMEHLDKKP